MSDQPVLRTESLRDLSELGDGFLMELIQLYQERAPLQLQNMKRSKETNEFAEIQHEAHSLKSSSAGIGAMRVAQLCRELEQYEIAAGVAATDQIKHLEALLFELEVQLNLALVALTQINLKSA